ncbi:structural maintenance of chromosomes protein 2-like [Watersipora subatra]|uniref:structural maintenance of chromosomes protein 2-like n=1 Tax=Watersipora subatra TaxID=2589382 RepID=UPI00355AE06D
MYIKSIVLDGFKSYAQRTEITGFDAMFNAITGLNGSGKSNILDSICFVLGISNLHQVRATNLQELVYKNGQAGITKATVSITFDNSDPEQCPFGYSQYEEIVVTRQVVVGGRNKYMINGSAAPNQKVADLFKSVSLNINNPHFLIMQGRITKVLNMKPPEILSMIEEAAGTRLYESKRENAEKVIEKKESKLREVDSLIEEETGPKLERLKKERDSYIEYQKIVREIDHLNKIYIAWQFTCAQKDRASSAEQLAKLEESIKQLNDRCSEITGLVEELSTEIESLEKQIQGEQADALVTLEKELHTKQQADAISSSNYDESVKEIKSQTKKLKELKKILVDDESILAKKRQELDQNTAANADAVRQRQEVKDSFAAAQKRFQTEAAGLASNEDGENATLNDQLIAAKNAISEAETVMKSSEMKVKHSEAEVKKRKAEVKQTSAEYDKDKVTLDNTSKQIKRFEDEQKQSKYVEGSLEKVRQEKSDLQKEAEQLQKEYNSLSDRFPSLQFDYTAPDRNFPHKKVRGPVAKLIQVKDVSTATALEVVAGGKLYNIVVDDDKTAQVLLDKGQLRRKYTILPLNKLTAKPVDGRSVARAKSLVGESNASLALELVGYEKQIEAAMVHVFGNTFVCTNSQDARKVTFDKQIMRRSVTLEGDSFDPAGTLTGGSRPQSSGILSKLSEINEIAHKLAECKELLLEKDSELVAVNKSYEQFSKLQQQLSRKQKEFELLRDKLKQTTHGAQLERIEKLEETISTEKQGINAAKETKEASKKKVAELEHMIKNAKEMHEQCLKQLETEMAAAKKEMENLEKKYAKTEQHSETLKLEVLTLEKQVDECKTQVEEVTQEIVELEKRSAELKEKVAVTRAAAKETEGALKAHRQQLAAWNKEMSSKVTELKKLKQEHTAATLKIEQFDHDMEAVENSAESASKEVENLKQKYDWIADEQQYFGQANSAYDFSQNDPERTASQISKLQEKRKGLERNVNMRAMSMLDQAQAQHNDMLRKRRILVQDKEKLAIVIAELNEKKNIAVEKAYKQVNKDFTSIFSTLLPGATAKLAPPDGASCLDGLEVKVGFGDVWKDSLTELSGGQRSLVALSLILSMLLFKPAPLYILDEVDAALDLSHTQNIGQMLKSHFTHSQFIVVSLKDGMFTNANVLFRTKFVDGVSTVTRYTQKAQGKPPLTERNGGTTSTVTVKNRDSVPENKRKRVKT